MHRVGACTVKSLNEKNACGKQALGNVKFWIF